MLPRHSAAKLTSHSGWWLKPRVSAPLHSFRLWRFLFIFGCTGSSLLCTDLPWLQRTGAALGLQDKLFSLWWLLSLQWGMQWQPTPVLLPGKSHRRTSVVGYSPRGLQRVGHDWATSLTPTHSCGRARTPGRTGFIVTACGLRSHGADSAARSMWNLPGTRIEPGSPALAGRFLTTGPLGKSRLWCVQCCYFYPCRGRTTRFWETQTHAFGENSSDSVLRTRRCSHSYTCTNFT